MPLFQPSIGTGLSGLSPYNLGTLRKPSAKAVGASTKVPLTKLDGIWVMLLVGLVLNLPSPTVKSVMVLRTAADVELKGSVYIFSILISLARYLVHCGISHQFHIASADQNTYGFRCCMSICLCWERITMALWESFSPRFLSTSQAAASEGRRSHFTSFQGMCRWKLAAAFDTPSSDFILAAMDAAACCAFLVKQNATASESSFTVSTLWSMGDGPAPAAATFYPRKAD